MVRRRCIRTYRSQAGRWGALKAVGEHLVEQGIEAEGSATLLRMNKPGASIAPAVPGRTWPSSGGGGVAIVVPIVPAHQAHAYRVFRGKTRETGGYGTSAQEQPPLASRSPRAD